MKKFWKKVLASSLAFICTVTAGVAAVATNGFGLFNAAQVEGFDHNKQLSFGNFFGNGITLTASAETAIQSSTVTDCGDISSLGTVNPASAPFAYRDLTLYKNSTITKVGVPVLSVSDYTSENLFTLYVVSYDEPLTTFTQVSEHKLTIPANTFTSNTVNAWHYFDVNITVGDNQTLAFGSTVDTVTWGYGANRNDSQRIFYTKTLGSSYTLANEANCLYFDVYTSASTTPSTPENGTVRLTATVTPSTAVNKGVNWSIAWQNASSTWASGKTVTDYVTVTPTADGALTADVTCKQAFGEQIIVTVTMRDYETIKATCTVDYSRKVETAGYDISFVTDEGEKIFTWSLNEKNSIVAFDFIDLHVDYGTIAFQTANGLYEIPGLTQLSNNIEWSDVYTIGSESSDNSVTSFSLSVAATEAYLTALENVGCTVTASPEEYVQIPMIETTFWNILFESFGADLNSPAVANEFLGELKSRASAEMLRFKMQFNFSDGTTHTINNSIKFNAASIQPVTLAEGISVLNNIVF